MKLVISGLILGLLVLFSFSFVVAESSGITMDFNVGNVADVAQEYVPVQSFWDVWGAYIVGLIILLIIIILLSKRRKAKRKFSPVKLKKKVVAKKRKVVRKVVKKKRR